MKNLIKVVSDPTPEKIAQARKEVEDTLESMGMYIVSIGEILNEETGSIAIVATYYPKEPRTD